MADLYLKPGELFFGVPSGPLRTLLGSCVAVTLWHPRLKLSGMCHFVLPERPPNLTADPRYGQDALDALMDAVRRHATVPSDYRAGIYGGGNMFPDFNPASGRPVGEQNVAAARRLARSYGLAVGEEQVGGYAYRQIRLDPELGIVTVQTTEIVRA